MKKRNVPFFIILGVCLIIISLSIMIAFQIRMHIGAQQVQNTVSKMNEILPERIDGIPGMYPDSGMPVLEMDRVDYVAMLDIPSFGLTLPVVDKWNKNKLFLSPARFFGSVYSNTLIIGGVDYPQQFGFCDKIEHGALVKVTDMTGAQFTYTVSKVNRSKHAETQWLMDTDSALTLFCYDIYSMEYIAVRCDLFCK